MRTMSVNIRLWLFASLLVSSSCQDENSTMTEISDPATLTPSVVDGGDTPAASRCLVCGEGMQVTNYGKMVGLSFGMFTCGSLAGAGLAGNIPDDQCAIAQSVAADTCVCMADGPTSIPIEVPTTAPAEAPYVCPVCEVGVVTIPDGIVSITSQRNRTCEEYMQASAAGIIEDTQCGLVQQYSIVPCGCEAADGSTPATAPAPSPTEPELAPPLCSICSEGMMLDDPDALVTIPNQISRTCAELDLALRTSIVMASQCDMMQPIAQASCECLPGSTGVSETTPPLEAYECNICGEGRAVTSPDGIVEIPTQPDRTCSELMQAAAIGNINEAQCSLLHPFVLGPCGCETAIYMEPSGIPSDMPSLAPSANTDPTSSPAPSTYYVTPKPGCFDDLQEIHDLESDLKDTSIPRKYILCPGTTFDMGVLDGTGMISEGQPFIMLRPNVIYQCGLDGSRLNECILKGGDFALTSYYGVFNGIYETVENVQIKGLIFEAQSMFAAVMEAAGEITFLDCAFRMHGNKVPILMQWRGGGPEIPTSPVKTRNLRTAEDQTASQLFYQRMREGPPSTAEAESVVASRRLQEYSHVVTFQDCVFRDNMVIENMGFPGIIENTFGSSLNIINCMFQDNVYGEEKNLGPYGYAIRSFGPVTIENSCFVDNVFYNHAPVLIFGAGYTASQNYIAPADEALNCDFIAVFASEEDVADQTPVCFDSDADTCQFTQPPSSAPTTKAPESNSTDLEMPPTDDGSGATTIHCILVGLLSLLVAGLV